MSFDSRRIGRRCGEQVVTIDRAPVQNFASALSDPSPIYQDSRAAHEAGFAEVPVPPTYPFVMAHWGVRAELLDQYEIDPVPANPLTGVADQLGPIALVIIELTDELGPGVVLHAGQEFDYHRTPVVGDVLYGVTRILDIFEKPSKDLVLTFVVLETSWVHVDTGDPVVTSRFTAVHQPQPRNSRPT